MDLAHSHTVSLDTGLDNYSVSDSGNLGPSPPSPTSIASELGPSPNLHCEEWLDGTLTTSKKRFQADLGRLDRNIKQRLLCGFFANEGNNYATLEQFSSFNTSCDVLPTEDTPCNPNGC